MCAGCVAPFEERNLYLITSASRAEFVEPEVRQSPAAAAAAGAAADAAAAPAKRIISGPTCTRLVQRGGVDRMSAARGPAVVAAAATSTRRLSGLGLNVFVACITIVYDVLV